MKKLILPICILFALNADAQRVPLFEVFTSSTCGPCKAGNQVYENVIAGKPATEYVSVKYQQNFPSTGDPYCTTESQSRRSSYYGINSIPRMEIDGGWDQNAQSFTNALYNQYKAVPEEYQISGGYTLNPTTKTITAKLKYKPLTTTAAATGARLYVVIIESQTVQNVKSNGETVFYNVVKKMLPNQSGTLLSGAVLNKTDSMSFNFTFPGSYRLPGSATDKINLATEHSVENFNNLKVVAWVQGSDKTVYNAANLAKVGSLGISTVSNTVDGLKVYPNPANNVVNVNLDMKKSDNLSASLISVNGSVAAQQTIQANAGNNTISFDTQNLAAGYYNLVVLDSEKNVFVEVVVVAH